MVECHNKSESNVMGNNVGKQQSQRWNVERQQQHPTAAAEQTANVRTGGTPFNPQRPVHHRKRIQRTNTKCEWNTTTNVTNNHKM